MNPKVLVLGLDGASFNLIQPWLNDNILANIKHLIDNGVWGEMESCIPPITCPNWKCYSTGKNPGKLGVFWWEHLNIKEKKVIIPNSTTFKSADIWDYLNKEGIKTGIIGMPTTYPPKRVEGFMVAGGPDAGDKGYTYPDLLQEELENQLNYRVHGDTDVSQNMEKGIKNALSLIKLNFDAAEYLLEKYSPSFLHVTSFQINGPLQHFFYNGEPTRRAWQLIDRRLGKLVQHFDYVLIMSDHGTSPMEKNWFINAWLKQQGYLKLKTVRTISKWRKLGKLKSQVLRLSKQLGIYHILKEIKPLHHISQTIPNEWALFGDHEGETVMDLVDWNETSVVGSPQGSIYINRELIEEQKDYDKLRHKLIHEIESIKDPETDEHLVEKVYKPEEIYKGEYVHNAPDLIALDSNQYHNRGGILKTNVFENSRWKGNNAKKGLFIFVGPEVRNGAQIEGVKIVDLAPTLLHIFNVPVPEDMDGRVLKEIFTENSSLAQREVTLQKSIEAGWGNESETDREVKERLEALGYL